MGQDDGLRLMATPERPMTEGGRAFLRRALEDASNGVDGVVFPAGVRVYQLVGGLWRPLESN